ncbi:DUF433 domain-containing protein [Zhongshania sp.]|uniref:DUF433 domain-containing protein n=1 Tax=Zhongshania sp. TaxID=1971902 RepID=UPI0035664803
MLRLVPWQRQQGMTMRYKDYIEIIPGKRSGKPYLKTTRITVYDVLTWLAQGMSAAEIQEDFPEVTPDHIQACLAYAASREHHLHTVSAA